MGTSLSKYISLVKLSLRYDQQLLDDQVRHCWGLSWSSEALDDFQNLKGTFLSKYLSLGNFFWTIQSAVNILLDELLYYCSLEKACTLHMTSKI